MGDVVKAVKRGKFIGWYVRYRDSDGRRKQRASHQPTKEAARRYLLEVEGRIARGLVGIPEPAPPAPTVTELVERFLNEYRRPRIKNMAKYRANVSVPLRRTLRIIGNLRVDAVTPSTIAKLRDELADRGAPNSVRLALACLGTCFNWATRQGIASTNPLKGAELPPRVDSVEYLSAEEVVQLLSVAEQQAQAGGLREQALYASVHFALFTGLRKGELAALRWGDLDLQTGRLTVS